MSLRETCFVLFTSSFLKTLSRPCDTKVNLWSGSHWYYPHCTTQSEDGVYSCTKKKEQLHLSLTSHINEEDFEHEEEEMSRLLKKRIIWNSAARFGRMYFKHLPVNLCFSKFSYTDVSLTLFLVLTCLSWSVSGSVPSWAVCSCAERVCFPPHKGSFP